MFCPHCHNKIPDGSNFCPLCYANLVGVKQQEKENAEGGERPRPAQKAAPRKSAKPAYSKGSRQSKRSQDKTPMIIAVGLILILVLIIVMIVRSMFSASTPAVVSTPAPQTTQQPQQENNFIVFGATNTPAPQLTATPNIEITPTPVPQETAAATTYKTLRRGDRGKDVVSMQEALVALGYLKGASDGNFGTGTKTAVENFQKENGLDVDGIAGAKTLEKLYNLADMTPIPDTTAAPGDILDLPG